MNKTKHPDNIKSVMDDPQGKRILFWILAIMVIGILGIWYFT